MTYELSVYEISSTGNIHNMCLKTFSNENDLQTSLYTAKALYADVENVRFAITVYDDSEIISFDVYTIDDIEWEGLT